MSLFVTPSTISVTEEDFKLFHAIDRELYSLLVNELYRDPLESMKTVAFWLWLERVGFRNVVYKILALPETLIDELADEAEICLECIKKTQFLYSDGVNDIPLTQKVAENEISLQSLHDNRVVAAQGLAKIVTEVCGRALTDIMLLAKRRYAAQSYSRTGFSQSRFLGGDWTCEEDIPPEDRTMFVTFSKGYPVTGLEVKRFFTRAFGNCIESIHMQEVKPHEQALFARVVLYSPSTFQLILNGVEKAKFTIKGRHVWVRKFVPPRPTV